VPLPYRRATVGSSNPAKVEAVRLALARLAPGCALQAVDVASGVGAQPVGDQATREGARNRARAALAATDAEVAFGLEGGVIHETQVVWLVSWVSAVARDGGRGDASGLRMRLPMSVAQRLAAGDELGTIIDDIFRVTASKQHTGAVGLLTEGFVSRTDAFADLVAMACAPLLRPDLYQKGENS
jgi:inosine/xanthosine triphosphatase